MTRKDTDIETYRETDTDGFKFFLTVVSTDKDFKQYTCTSSSLSASISHKNTFKWIDEDITRRSSTVSSESEKANVDCITSNFVSKESSFSGSAEIQVFHSVEAKSYIHVT